MKTLIPWRRRTEGALESLRHEMSDLMERFFGEKPEGNGGEALQPWAPRVDLEETDTAILVKADLPGVDPKDVEISVRDDSLILSGEKKEERKEEKKNYLRTERFVGQFYREIPLPAGTDVNKITATSNKGVITVTIPRTPQVQSKRIAVKPQD